MQVPQEAHKICSDTALDPDTPEKATKAYTLARSIQKDNSEAKETITNVCRGGQEGHIQTMTDSPSRHRPTAHTPLHTYSDELRPEISLIDTHSLTDNTHVRPSDRLGI